jgi:hypothetical protein
MCHVDKETTNMIREKTSINNENTTSEQGIEQYNNKILLSPMASIV